jgi:hypothetical protein
MVALAALFTATGLHAQDLSSTQVPAAATTSFQKALPGINPRWVAGPSGSYEALFMRDGLAQVYAYDQAGVLQTKKIKTALTSLPATVQRSLDAGYAGGNVEAAYKVMTRSQEKYYEVQLAQSGQRERLRYSLEGQPIGKTTLGPVASAATVSAKPAPSPTIASAAKPAPAPAAKPAPAPAKPAPAPAPVVKTVPKPAPTTMSMRGEATEDSDDLMDEEELDDLLEEEEEEDTFDPLEEEEDDLLEDDEDWEDIDDDL